MLGSMPHPDDAPLADRLEDIRTELDAALADPDATSCLPHLRAASELLAAVIDDTMASAVVHLKASLRSAGAGAGLSENAVGPRLARTALLAPYANDSGRVTASGVERARYDHETGQVREPEGLPAPMRFKPRRTT